MAQTMQLNADGKQDRSHAFFQAAQACLLRGSVEHWLRNMREAAKVNVIDAVRHVVEVLEPLDATLPLRLVKWKAKWGAAKFIVSHIEGVARVDTAFARHALSVALKNIPENSVLRKDIAHKKTILGIVLQ